MANFSWTIGLSSIGGNGSQLPLFDYDLTALRTGTYFWRMEIEIIRNLNMLILMVSRYVALRRAKNRGFFGKLHIINSFVNVNLYL